MGIAPNEVKKSQYVQIERIIKIAMSRKRAKETKDVCNRRKKLFAFFIAYSPSYGFTRFLIWMSEGDRTEEDSMVSASLKASKRSPL